MSKELWLRFAVPAALALFFTVLLGCLITPLTTAKSVKHGRPTDTLPAWGQSHTQAPAEQMVDQLHKNIQVLKGMPESQLVPTMNFISSSLGVRCNFCHVNKDGNWDFASDEKTEKVTAREMIRMVLNINKTTFKGNTEVSCWTCHRGRTRAMGVPQLPLPAAPPRPIGGAGAAPREPLPTIDSVLARYQEAIGGPATIDKLKTRTMKGTYTASNGEVFQYEVFQSAPDSFHSVLSGAQQRIERGISGNTGWHKNQAGVFEARGENLLDLKRAAQFFRDLKLKDQFSRISVAGKEKINDRDAYVVRATTTDNRRERLFFDVESGLMVRRIIYLDTMLGVVPEQMDFGDYREVNGVKLPFTVQVSSMDPFITSTQKFTEIRINVPVNETEFKKP